MKELIERLSLHRLSHLDNHSHRMNSMKATCLKQNQQEKNLKGPNLFFNFNNNRHKHGSYDFHNVEEEERHYSSPLDKSNSCVSQ